MGNVASLQVLRGPKGRNPSSLEMIRKTSCSRDQLIGHYLLNHEFQTPIPYGKHKTSRPSRSCELTICLGDGIPGIPSTGKTTLSCPYTAWRCTRNCLRLPAGRRILRPRSDPSCFLRCPDPMAKPLENAGPPR